MPRALPTRIVQDPSDGFRCLPHLETQPPDLRVSFDVLGGDRIRARMSGRSVPALQGGEHKADLSSRPEEVLGATARLCARWKERFVDFQPADDQGRPLADRRRPYASAADLPAARHPRGRGQTRATRWLPGVAPTALGCHGSGLWSTGRQCEVRPVARGGRGTLIGRAMWAGSPPRPRGLAVRQRAPATATLPSGSVATPSRPMGGHADRTASMGPCRVRPYSRRCDADRRNVPARAVDRPPVDQDRPRRAGSPGGTRPHVRGHPMVRGGGRGRR